MSLETVYADMGYTDTNELEKIDGKNIMAIVPSKRQGQQYGKLPFSEEPRPQVGASSKENRRIHRTCVLKDDFKQLWEYKAQWADESFLSAG